MGDLSAEDLGAEDMGLEGEEDLGGEDLGGEDLGGEDLGGEDLGTGDLDAGPLLTADPVGKRDDKIRHYEKGSYKLKDVDRRNKGARKRSFLSQGNHEKGTNNDRNVWKGAQELLRLGNGVTEGVDDTYRGEEKKLFEAKSVHREVKSLIEQLEKKEDEKEIAQE